jgi:hypothetical protein
VGREKKKKNKHNNMMGSKRDVNMARKKQIWDQLF